MECYKGRDGLRGKVNPVVRSAHAEVGSSFFQRKAGFPRVIASQVEGVDLNLFVCGENGGDEATF